MSHRLPSAAAQNRRARSFVTGFFVRSDFAPVQNVFFKRLKFETNLLIQKSVVKLFENLDLFY
jgi:hypothetical protein